ncbi:MAG: hypothetical protein NZ741_13530, partial [Armatimonadetes bacterium]|nr:hypothetical protein [Armatimonadota bacterium]
MNGKNLPAQVSQIREGGCLPLIAPDFSRGRGFPKFLCQPYNFWRVTLRRDHDGRDGARPSKGNRCVDATERVPSGRALTVNLPLL